MAYFSEKWKIFVELFGVLILNTHLCSGNE
nr:MAG TPA: hypothetical protein [Caudoviricetes sp.]